MNQVSIDGGRINVEIMGCEVSTLGRLQGGDLQTAVRRPYFVLHCHKAIVAPVGSTITLIRP